MNMTLEEFYEAFCNMLIEDEELMMTIGHLVASAVSEEIARDISDGRYTG